MGSEMCIRDRPNIFYFTGFPKGIGSLLMLRKGEGTELLVPLLDYERALSSVKSKDINIVPFSRYKVPDVDNVITDVLTYLKNKLSDTHKLGIDLGYVNSLIYNLIKSTNSDIIDLTSDILSIRAIKDNYEIELITNALRITEDALRKSINELRPNIAEAEFAGLLEMNMRFLGAEGFSFDTIVASGINSSYPHAIVSCKRISEGEPIVCLLYTSPSPRDLSTSRMPSSA